MRPGGERAMIPVTFTAELLEYAREPNLHADCATHVCRNCGTEWGNHDGPPTA